LPPEHRAREHLPQRLVGVEAVARRERDPPGGDLLRAKVADSPLAEDGYRVSEQPAQRVDRHRVDVTLFEARLHQFGDGERSRDALLPQQLRAGISTFFDFTLTDNDMAQLDQLSRTGGTGRALERKW
jgi:hypothetical protein